MNAGRLFLLAAVWPLAGLICTAQDPVPSAPDTPTVVQEPVGATNHAVTNQGAQGLVTGTVICTDNHKPARVAQVVLIPVSGDSPAHQKGAVTDLDGKFAIPRVPDGKYYVSVQFPGYLNALADFSPAKLADMSPEARKDFDAHATIVTVSAREPADVSMELERAAEIDGTVQYDDGSPAIGLHVDLKPKEEKPAAPDADSSLPVVSASLGSLQQFTDDRGHFRILGVSPGEYLVSVTVPAGTAQAEQRSPLVGLIQTSAAGALVVYPGGILRASEAKTIKIDTAGGSVDAEITIPLTRLHTVRGELKLKSSGDPPPGGTLQLLYADTREVARVAIASDGEFELPFIPEGSFILRATAGAEPLPAIDAEQTDEAGVLAGGNHMVVAGSGKPEDGTEVPVEVSGDLEGITISVPDPSPNKPAPASETTEPAPGTAGVTPAANGPR